MKLSSINQSEICRSESKGLFHNINKRKRRGTSRSKKDSTIDQSTYEEMDTWDINESFDMPVSIKWVNRKDDYWLGKFYVDLPEGTTNVYEINISCHDGDVWDISFYLTAEKTSPNGDYDPYWTSYKITGSGRSHTVLASVMAAIKEWYETVKPQAFTLLALEKSRVDLYLAMFKRFLPKQWNYAYIDKQFWAARDIDPRILADKDAKKDAVWRSIFSAATPDD